MWFLEFLRDVKLLIWIKLTPPDSSTCLWFGFQWAIREFTKFPHFPIDFQYLMSQYVWFHVKWFFPNSTWNLSCNQSFTKLIQGLERTYHLSQWEIVFPSFNRMLISAALNGFTQVLMLHSWLSEITTPVGSQEVAGHPWMVVADWLGSLVVVKMQLTGYVWSIVSFCGCGRQLPGTQWVY